MQLCNSPALEGGRGDVEKKILNINGLLYKVYYFN